MNLFLAGFAGLFLLGVGIQRWRLGVFCALILVVFEGAIRKWLFPGASQFVYFAKDIVLLGAYIGFFKSSQAQRFRFNYGLLPGLLLAAAIIVGLQTLNNRLGSFWLGFFGFKTYLCYAPLCFLVPHLFEDASRLMRYLQRYLLLVIPVCLLGVAQFAAPTTSILNQYASGAAAVSKGEMTEEEAGLNVATFGSAGNTRARITGTFSYISGLTTYLVVSAVFVIATLARPSTPLWFWLGIAEFSLICGAVLMSGSRAPGLMLLILVAGAFLTAKGRLRRILLVVVSGGVIVCAYTFQEAYKEYINRIETAGDTVEGRVFQHGSEMDSFFSAAGLFGFGAGATHPGSEGIRVAFNLPHSAYPPPLSEAEHIRVLLELGVVGVFVWYILRSYLLFLIFETWRRLRDPFLKTLALTILLWHLINISGALVLNHTFGVYYWFTCGLVFMLPRLEGVSAGPNLRRSWRRLVSAHTFSGERPPEPGANGGH